MMADRLQQLNIANILLTGGEPFARKDLEDIVRIFTNRGFSVRIVTNGASFVSTDRLQSIIDAGIDALQVSFDSMRPEIHDEIAGKQGTWLQAKKTLEYAATHLHQGMVCAITVVSSLNINELPAIAKYLTSIGAYSIFQPVHLSCDEGEAGVIGMSDCSAMQILPAQHDTVRHVYTQLLAMKKQGFNILSSDRFLHDSINYFVNGRRKWICDAFKYYLTILPHGEVLPCMRYEDCEWLNRLNIVDDSFCTTFKSAALQQEAQRYRKECPGCVYSCYREMSYLFHRPDVILDIGLMLLGKKLKK